MLTQEQTVEIKVLARRGLAIRDIARQLGCSRNTVKRYLKEADASRYGPRQARPTKLDPFKAYVLERIEAARPYWIPAAVLNRLAAQRQAPKYLFVDNVLNASRHCLRGNSDPGRTARAVRRRQTRRATAIQWSSAVVQGSLA